LLIGAGVALWAVGCGHKETEIHRTVQAQGGFSITDALGRQVAFEKTPQRLVSLAPSITEILFALGLGGEVVGVTTWDDYPPEVQRIEKVGDYGNPSLEKIIWLKADLVLVTYGVPKPSIEALEKQGLTVMALPDDSLADVLQSIRLVGKVCGVSKKSEELASSLEARIEAVRANAEGQQPSQRPKALFLISLSPLMCAGSKTFINDVIDTAGGENLGAQFGENYPTISAEVLLKQKPDALFLAEDVAKAAEKKDGRKILRTLGLSDRPRHTLPDDLMLRPGPRAVDGLELMAKALHPGASGPKEAGGQEAQGGGTQPGD